ncbi:MAG: EscU/YscU/HrcU family type III secretion system export apparatus switch protein [Proteobacteria bacterium]|nr:EscU/YscU/HrcU family type III secretion system export apparatus switch protein [Pseudomonadota bacterium]
MAEKAFNRSEKATPFKLKKAKQKGQSAKSMLCNQLMVLIIAGVGLLWLSASITKALKSDFYTLLHLSGGFNFSFSNWQYLASTLLSKLLGTIMPIFLAVILAVVLGNLLQSGFIWSFEPMKPDVNRLNPVSGFKRLFNLKMVYELVKNLLLFTILCLVVYYCLHSQINTLYQMTQTSPQHYGTVVSHAVVQMSKYVVAVIALAAIIDVLFTRWRFNKEMMMSKQELKDEYKQQQGSPEVKQKRKQLLRQSYQQAQAITQVPQADIIITNPTHIAVALAYDQQRMIAPKIIAKGQDKLAQRIRQIAKKHHVYITENKPLARKLYQQKTGSYIDISDYEMVAHMLRKAYQNKQQGVSDA